MLTFDQLKKLLKFFVSEFVRRGKMIQLILFEEGEE